MTKIYFVLAEKKVTKKQLAVHLGLPASVISCWKSGRSRSYTRYISQIADFLGVSTDWLLGISSERTGQDKAPAETGDGRNVVRIAGRDGTYVERLLSDKQTALVKELLEQMTPVDDDLI